MELELCGEFRVGRYMTKTALTLVYCQTTGLFFSVKGVRYLRSGFVQKHN